MRSLLVALAVTLWMGLQVPVLAGPERGSYQVVHGWPQLPEGFALGHVTGVEVDSHNHVFVFHRGDRPILCFEGNTGKIVASWGDGLFVEAHGLTVDTQDNVWVTDTKQHQVFKFSHDGKLLLTLGAQGVPGLDGKHLNAPTDVTVTPSGEFYVSDGYGKQSGSLNSPPKGISCLTGEVRVTRPVSLIRLTGSRSTLRVGFTWPTAPIPASRSSMERGNSSISGRAPSWGVPGVLRSGWMVTYTSWTEGTCTPSLPTAAAF